MNSIPHLKPLIDRNDVDLAVKRIASDIQQDYAGKEPLFIGVLTGSFMFVADLVRYLNLPLEVEFVRLSSYGSGTVSSGRVKIVQKITSWIKDRDIVIVEDIVDTGITLDFLISYLKRKKPKSIKICALLDKEARRQVPVKIDYCGFIVPDEFVVGYGIDWNNKYRYLPGIYTVHGV